MRAPRLRVGAEMLLRPRRARDTVAWDTPARRATSCEVTRRGGFGGVIDLEGKAGFDGALKWTGCTGYV